MIVLRSSANDGPYITLSVIIVRSPWSPTVLSPTSSACRHCLMSGVRDPLVPEKRRPQHRRIVPIAAGGGEVATVVLATVGATTVSASAVKASLRTLCSTPTGSRRRSAKSPHCPWNRACTRRNTRSRRRSASSASAVAAASHVPARADASPLESGLLH